MSLVVDSDILGIIQRAGGLTSIGALGRLPWLVTDAVWYELTDGAAVHGAYPATVEEMRQFLVTIAGEPTSIEPMTREAAALAQLSAPPVKEDPGELSVIAVVACRPDTTAVLHDRAAVFRGIEELRGRVLSLHGLLGVLRDEHALPVAEATRLSEFYCKRYHPTRPPLWW